MPHPSVVSAVLILDYAINSSVSSFRNEATVSRQTCQHQFSLGEVDSLRDGYKPLMSLRHYSHSFMMRAGLH